MNLEPFIKCVGDGRVRDVAEVDVENDEKTTPRGMDGRTNAPAECRCPNNGHGIDRSCCPRTTALAIPRFSSYSPRRTTDFPYTVYVQDQAVPPPILEGTPIP